MRGDWGISFFKKWERVLKVNSFTDEGKNGVGEGMWLGGGIQSIAL
jgi:hypothetical protein